MALSVSANGYPLAYEIIEGNKYEGHTTIPVLGSFEQTPNRRSHSTSRCRADAKRKHSGIIPFIDETFRTRPTKEFRGIAGLSMGGFRSTAMRNPDIFTVCAAFSSESF